MRLLDMILMLLRAVQIGTFGISGIIPLRYVSMVIGWKKILAERLLTSKGFPPS